MNDYSPMLEIRIGEFSGSGQSGYKHATVAVRLQASKEFGNSSGSLILKSDLLNPSPIFRVQWVVESRIVAKPSVLFFPRKITGSQCEGRLSVYSTKDAAFKITSIRVGGRDIVWSESDGFKSKQAVRHDVSFVLSVPKGQGAFRQQIQIMTDDALQPVVIVPWSVYIN